MAVVKVLTIGILVLHIFGKKCDALKIVFPNNGDIQQNPANQQVIAVRNKGGNGQSANYPQQSKQGNGQHHASGVQVTPVPRVAGKSSQGKSVSGVMLLAPNSPYAANIPVVQAIPQSLLTNQNAGDNRKQVTVSPASYPLVLNYAPIASEKVSYQMNPTASTFPVQAIPVAAPVNKVKSSQAPKRKCTCQNNLGNNNYQMPVTSQNVPAPMRSGGRGNGMNEQAMLQQQMNYLTPNYYAGQSGCQGYQSGYQSSPTLSENQSLKTSSLGLLVPLLVNMLKGNKMNCGCRNNCACNKPYVNRRDNYYYINDGDDDFDNIIYSRIIKQRPKDKKNKLKEDTTEEEDLYSETNENSEETSFDEED